VGCKKIVRVRERKLRNEKLVAEATLHKCMLIDGVSKEYIILTSKKIVPDYLQQ